MEVNTFIETQFNPILIVLSHYGTSTHLPVRQNGINNIGLWQYTNDGICIPNLMTIDIGIGYDINEYSPNSDEYAKRMVISLVTEIPDSFYTNDV